MAKLVIVERLLLSSLCLLLLAILAGSSVVVHTPLESEGDVSNSNPSTLSGWCCSNLECVSLSTVQLELAGVGCREEGSVCDPGVLGGLCCENLKCVLDTIPQLGTPGRCELI